MKVVILLALSACTTLGPIPATTGVAAVPSGAPGLEGQVAFVPGFYLSRSAQNQGKGAIMPQLSAVFDPDRWLGLPGLIIGGRIYGADKDTPGEPLIGYRHAFDEGLSASIVGFFTSKDATRSLASYHATHGGAEAAVDAQLLGSGWVQLHWQLAASATHISASGTYCVNQSGVAIDCSTDPAAQNTMVDRKLSSTVGAATSTVALDFFRSRGSIFHGARLGWMLAAGSMPQIQPGGSTATALYWSTGLSVTFGLGASALEHTVIAP